jgi:hypothetical protein
MKRNKMKKIVVLLAVLFSVVVPIQSQAAAGERIVIIDNAFNLSQITGSVEFVCVASDLCVNKTVSNKDHGTQMALIARQQNPSATLVLIQAAPVSKRGIATDVNLHGFINALDFVNSNSNAVSAVSFSRYMNNTTAKLSGQCFPPASAPYTPQTGFDKVKSSVISLNLKGIQVYASAGNNSTKPIDFPACVSEVVSVGSYLYGKTYKSGNVDILTTLSTPEKLSTMKGLIDGVSIEFSTSAASAAVAANSKTLVTSSGAVTILSN